MKRIIALALTFVMLVTSVALYVSAADGMYIDTTFGSMEEFMKYFFPGAFFIPDGENQVFGYSEAKALQSLFTGEGDLDLFAPSPTTWREYDTCMTLACAPDTDSGSRSIQIWYCDQNLYEAGYSDQMPYILLVYYIEDPTYEGYFVLTTRDPYTDEVVILAQSAKQYDLDFDSGNTFYDFGMSVGPGRIRGFLNGECVVDWVDVKDDYMVARKTVTPFVFWNEGNMVIINEFKAASYGYLYPLTEPQTEPTPTQPTDPVTSIQSSVSEVIVTVTNEKGEVETDEKGEVKTEVSEVIVTEIVTVTPADTQSGNGGGGNSATTGDSAFIVVAAMVLSLGCALAVKKVTVK